MFEPKIKQTIETALTKGTPFALFRLPGSHHFHLSEESNYRLLFNNFAEPFYKATDCSKYKDGVNIEAIAATASENKYMDNLKILIDSLKDFPGYKTVLSRTITGFTDTSLIIDVATGYFSVNPDALCVLMQTSDRKIWIMATPEILLQKKGCSFETMALAGTRHISDDDVPWDKKNIEEQKVVSDYIAEILNDKNLKFSMSEPFTLKSNNIEHICTLFKGCITGQEDIASLVDALSPTPAVCGFPVEKAKGDIERLETHNRGFYAGYTVVENQDGATQVFVNLRCACIDMRTGRYVIFVGGGITSASEPEHELYETRMKGETLYKLLEQRKATTYTDTSISYKNNHNIC